MSSFRTLLIILHLPLLAVSVSAQEIEGKTYEQWKRDLTHPDPRVRGNAILLTPRFGERAMEAVPILVDRTGDREPEVRVKAILALKQSKIKNGDLSRVVRALGNCVSHDSVALIRYEAASALIRFGADAREAVSDLLQGLDEKNTWELRQICIQALIVAGVDETKGADLRVINALILHTKPTIEPAASVRRDAIIALGAMGRTLAPSKRRQALAAIREHFHDANKPIRIRACAVAMILEKKVNEKNLKIIADHLKDPDWDVRVQAVEALAALLERTRKYVPALAQLLQVEKDSQVIGAARRALDRLAQRDRHLLKTLAEETQREESEFTPLVISACEVLVRMEALQVEVMGVLGKVRARKDLDAHDAKLVRETQRRITTAHRDLVDIVEKVLNRADVEDKSKETIRKAIEEIRKRSGDTNGP